MARTEQLQKQSASGSTLQTKRRKARRQNSQRAARLCILLLVSLCLSLGVFALGLLQNGQTDSFRIPFDLPSGTLEVMLKEETEPDELSFLKNYRNILVISRPDAAGTSRVYDPRSLLLEQGNLLQARPRKDVYFSIPDYSAGSDRLIGTDPAAFSAGEETCVLDSPLLQEESVKHLQNLFADTLPRSTILYVACDNPRVLKSIQSSLEGQSVRAEVLEEPEQTGPDGIFTGTDLLKSTFSFFLWAAACGVFLLFYGRSRHPGFCSLLTVLACTGISALLLACWLKPVRSDLLQAVLQGSFQVFWPLFWAAAASAALSHRKLNRRLQGLLQRILLIPGCFAAWLLVFLLGIFLNDLLHSFGLAAQSSSVLVPVFCLAALGVLHALVRQLQSPEQGRRLLPSGWLFISWRLVSLLCTVQLCLVQAWSLAAISLLLSMAVFFLMKMKPRTSS